MLQNASQQCLLGMDFLERIGSFTINIKWGIIHFSNNTVQLCNMLKEKGINNVKLLQSTKLPRSAVVTFAKVQTEVIRTLGKEQLGISIFKPGKFYNKEVGIS